MEQSNTTNGENCVASDPVATIQSISASICELARTIDSSDLTALSNLHQALGDLKSAADAQGTCALADAATASMQIVEKVVLNEVDSATAALQQVIQNLTELNAAVPAEPSDDPHAATQAQLSEADFPLIQDFISEAASHVEAAEAGLLQLEDDASNADAMNSVFRGFHTIKGVAGFLNLVQVGQLAHAAESVLDLARKGNLRFERPVADLILQSIDAMRKLIELVGAATRQNGIVAPMEGLESLLDRLQKCARGESTGASKPVAAASGAAPTEPAKAEVQSPRPGRAQHGDTTVKVSTERLDALINMVGELVIAQAMVGEDISSLAAQDRRVSRNVAHLGKITRELQDLSMAMRMVPIQGVFQKMSRLVRDLAHKANKEIELSLIGGETELDRNVVEAISDPLVHMVRNAADHGIESPEDREKAGKPRVGKLTLKAYHQAGNIVIDISDDGRGLNKARILRKAIEAGVIRENQELSDRDIFNLIFHAGLSTADKVTDVSGRGVGMDVVKRNVEALRGHIDIISAEGKGSTFSIRLPLTLAVIDGLVVKVGSERYIIPMTSIEESLRPRESQISSVQNRGELCTVRDQLLPILRLHRVFNVKPATEELTGGLLVIVQGATRRFCLFVDELLGQQQVVIKSLGPAFGQIRGISGGAILGDGNVSLILDVPGLVSAAFGE